MMNQRSFVSGHPLAAIGGLWGAAWALLLGGLRFSNWLGLTIPAPMSGPPLIIELPGIVAFLLAYLVPFAVALLALRWPQAEGRVLAWLAAGLAAILAPGAQNLLTDFTPFTLIFLPSAVCLIAAGAGEFFAAGRSVRSIRLLAALLPVLFWSAAAGMLVRESFQCWELVRQDERRVWRQTEVIRNEEGMIGSRPSSSPILKGICGDVILPGEAALSAAFQAAGVASILLLRERLAPPSESPPR